MAVGVERDRNLGMPKPFLDHLWVDALEGQQRRGSVSQIVEPDSPEARPLEERQERPPDEVALPHRAPVSIAEHELLGVSLGQHPLPMLVERGHSDSRKVHGAPSLRGLRLVEPEAAGHLVYKLDPVIPTDANFNDLIEYPRRRRGYA